VRTGHYQEAVSETEIKWGAKPEKADSSSEHAWVASLHHLPDQEVTYRQASVVRYKVKKNKLFVPLSINGKSVEFFVDTGANLSFLSESEAKRLGLVVQQSNAKVYGAAGAQAAFRTAVAQELTVGDMRLRNVAFMVLRDDEAVFPELEPGERGAIGLPVILALGTVRWNASGDFRVGFLPESGRKEQNLCFDGANPVTRFEFEQRQLDALFDTGDEVSEMGPAFAKQFAVFVNQHGKKSTKRAEGFGGSTELNEVLLPELRCKVGGLQVALHPAHVLLDQTGGVSHSYFASVGLDLLRQARQVTIDFKGLRLTLE
jgi:clan AA aspartic protease (TIGR02281 family)